MIQEIPVPLQLSVALFLIEKKTDSYNIHSSKIPKKINGVVMFIQTFIVQLSHGVKAYWPTLVKLVFSCDEQLKK